LVFFILVSTFSLSAAEPPPTLRPPRGEIGPTYWEQHSSLIIIGASVAVVVLTALIILVTRPKRYRSEPPEVLARRGLTALVNRPEDGALIMEASRIFRRYVIFAFNLPPVELTTAELNQTLQSSPKADSALVTGIAEFLRQCDEEKFAPLSNPPRLHTVLRALELLDKIEKLRLQSKELAA